MPVDGPYSARAIRVPVLPLIWRLASICEGSTIEFSGRIQEPGKARYEGFSGVSARLFSAGPALGLGSRGWPASHAISAKMIMISRRLSKLIDDHVLAALGTGRRTTLKGNLWHSMPGSKRASTRWPL